MPKRDCWGGLQNLDRLRKLHHQTVHIAICREVPECHMANIVEGGLTPNLSMEQLQDVGFQFAAYPLTLLAASMQAMKQTLELMRQDLPRANHLMDFEELRDRIGFNEYYETSQVYGSSRRS